MPADSDKVVLDYGRSGLELSLDRSIAEWTVIEPRESPPVQSFTKAFAESVSNPIGAPNLKDVISSGDKVVIVTADGTRSVPNQLLIPAVIDFCNLSPENVTILIGTGSHHPHTANELVDLLGTNIIRKCKVVCHDASDKNELEFLGTIGDGIPVSINRCYLQSDKRLVMGFIEPHLFAGFSGGAKGICPAICGLDTIDAFHSYKIIGHPDSDYGKLENNPQQQAAREVASFAPPDFLINVLLNSSKRITHIFSGHYIEAHRIGCEVASEIAMVEMGKPFPIVVTTNSGYPLDQNLYQTVKGISAAALIVENGGTIFVASECIRGIPDDGNFTRIMSSQPTLESLRHMMSDKDYRVTDRWQAQKLAMTLEKADVRIYSSLNREKIETCKMAKVDNLQAAIEAEIRRLGVRPEIAVLPRGPLTIPTVR